MSIELNRINESVTLIARVDSYKSTGSARLVEWNYVAMGKFGCAQAEREHEIVAGQSSSRGSLRRLEIQLETPLFPVFLRVLKLVTRYCELSANSSGPRARAHAPQISEAVLREDRTERTH